MRKLTVTAIFALALCVSAAARAATTDFSDMQAELAYALEDAGMPTPLEIEEFALSVKGHAVPLSLQEVQEKTEWQSFSIEEVTVNAMENRFIATILAYENAQGKGEGERAVVRGKVQRMAEVPVLRESMNGGEVISYHDIDWITLPERRVRGAIVMNLDELVGMSVRRRILSGKPVKASEIEAPLMVKKGEALSIVYKTGAMELRTLAVAEQNGRKGEMISVRNPSSRKIVQAVVKDVGVAYVRSAVKNRNISGQVAYSAEQKLGGKIQ